ncbi:hypothetical protein JVT61DRAFT_4055 [Boletus reticuloceps]|uniref:Uncharacterized protein n=1 Tax=Boletus reticuloceps TaxID=495285 RepID=A0A8I3A7L8_9AGAM|nr:hypothetical protein JVT61DRAFT_4055 [Boletus reticuloceps]
MSAERLSPESSLTGLCSQLVLALVSPTRTMRVIPLLAAFIFLGIAAAGAIPGIAVLHDIVPDGKDGQGGHSMGLPTATTLFPIPRATPPDVAEHTKHTGSSSGDSHHHNKSSKKGKHSHSTISRGAKPTNVGSHTPPLPTASASDGASHWSSKTTVDYKKSELDPTGTVSILKSTGGVA